MRQRDPNFFSNFVMHPTGEFKMFSVRWDDLGVHLHLQVMC